MALVVIGGHSRNVGKTSVVAGIIAALREYQWTAMKITQYGHGICSKNGKQCHCASRRPLLGDFRRARCFGKIRYLAFPGCRSGSRLLGKDSARPVG